MTFKKIRIWLATVVAACCLIPASFARGTASSPPVRHRASRKSRKSHKSKSRHDASHRKSSRSRRRRRSASSRSTFHQRFSKLHPEPGRVDQIQQALIEAGDLQGEPTGKWDPATRAAMSRYQAANRFPVTGLPDAKSLMKLGLGPHPLPESLATNRTAVSPGASPETPTGPVAGGDKSESAPPE